MTNATAKIAPAVAVTARPWQSGKALKAQKGIVLKVDHTSDSHLVWFPALGDPRPGTVQAIFTREITDVRPLEGEGARYLRNAYQACKRVNKGGAWRTEWRVAGHLIERVARQHGR